MTSVVGIPVLTATGIVDIFGHTSGAFTNTNVSVFVKSVDGYIYTTGVNANGQLGLGNTTNVSVWTRITSLGTNISKVWVAGYNAPYNFAWDPVAGKLYAWGYNGYGTFGNGTVTSSTVPVDVTASWGVSAANPPVDMQFGNDYYVTSGAAGTSCGLRRADGVILTAGYNGWGQIGNNTRTQQTVAYPVWNGTLGTAVDYVVHGIGSEWVLTTAGDLWGWGYNGLNQMANGTATDVLIPTKIPLVSAANGFTAPYFLNRQGNSNTYGYYTTLFVGSAPGNPKYAILGQNDASGYYGNGSTVQSATGAYGYCPSGEWFTTVGVLYGTTYGRCYVAATNKNNLYAWGYGGQSVLQIGSTNPQFTATQIRHPGLNYNT